MPLPLQVAFVAGSSGIWRIERITAVAGESLPPAERLAGMSALGQKRTARVTERCLSTAFQPRTDGAETSMAGAAHRIK